MSPAQWFYAKDGIQNGPIPRDELTDLLASGALPPSTPVWSNGMAEWLAADQVKGLARNSESKHGEHEPPRLRDGESESPYAPPATSSEIPIAPVPTSGPQVRPWIRFWARTVDIILIGFAVGIILAFGAPATLEMADFLLNIVILALAIFIQAGFFAVFGTTPGKAMLRVSVRHADGSKLGFPAALARETKVFFAGLGVGIPLIALITQIASYSKLNSEGITSWDRSANLVVSHQAVGVLRWLLLTGVIVLFFALVAYGSSA